MLMMVIIEAKMHSMIIDKTLSKQVLW